MLGNQLELWESMLGIMKLGAVLLPTTTALGSADLADRVARAGVAAVICNPADTGKFVDVPGEYLKLATGAVDGWHTLPDATKYPDDPLGNPGTETSDALLLYFTSGTTSRPKLVKLDQLSTVGHLSTVFWLGLQPGDIHQKCSLPGMGQARLVLFLRPLDG